MSNPRIEALGAGRFRVSGVLNAVTVIDLLKQSREAFAGVTRMEIDLSTVPESDSAGLALLLEWLRAAREAKQQIQFANIPAQISALARISEVDDLLAANGGVGTAEKPQVADQKGPPAPKSRTG